MTDPRIEAAARALCERQGYPSGGTELATSCGFEENWEAFSDDAQAALEAADAASWKPIETAPHGVTLKLAWKDKYGEWKYAFDKASWDWKLGDYRSGVSHHGRATHWQPLPKPPTP